VEWFTTYVWSVTTGIALIDVWTGPHLGFWVYVGSTLWGLKILKSKAVFGCMLGAVAWELFEHFIAFPLWPERWQDPESWVNAWVSDPLTCVIGVLGMYWLLDNRKRRKGLQ
jgi:hypothetical protein